MSIGFHGNANAPNPWSHFKTVGSVVAVDVVPVVEVEVVVVAGQQAEERSPCIFKFSLRLQTFSQLGLPAVAAVFYVQQKDGIMQARVAPSFLGAKIERKEGI